MTPPNRRWQGHQGITKWTTAAVRLTLKSCKGIGERTDRPLSIRPLRTMSVISDIINQRLHPSSDMPSGVLMRWSEPTELYWRKRLGVFGFLSRWLAGDSMVELREDCIYQRIGGGGTGAARASGFRSAYADIESCTVHRDSYKGKEFSVLRLKNRHKLVIVIGPVELIVVPSDISVESVLKILRDKGVHV